MERQKTLKGDISFKGVGLHTGKEVRVSLKPAEEAYGIRFVRVDLPGRPEIQATVGNILEQPRRLRRTSIGKDGVEIHTVEHLLSAFLGLGIDNVIVEIDGEEVPGLDGSALPFVEFIERIGLKEQDAAKVYLPIKTPLWLESDGATLTALPSKNLRVSYMLDYTHPYVKSQFLDLLVTPDNYKKLLAGGRTFCLEEEVEGLRRQGLGKGASYENTIVVGEKGAVENSLRFDDEFVRHKIVDLLGDFCLLSANVKAHLVAVKSGHTLNIELLQKLQNELKKNVLAGVGSSYAGNPQPPFGPEEIMKILPHRYPFLFVDRVISLEKNRIIGVKNLSYNDYFFKGHFPGRPVMPGVLIIEALAQTAGILMLSRKENLGKLAYFMSINKAKFRKTVLPGDQLILDSEVLKAKSKTIQIYGKALVNNKVVAEADLMFTLVEGKI